MTDAYYLAMAALDQYPIEDGLPKSTSVVFRIHQLGQAHDADEGFIEALEALKAVTLARGTLNEQFAEMRESIARLEALVLAQSAELRTLRERLEQPPTP